MRLLGTRRSRHAGPFTLLVLFLMLCPLLVAPSTSADGGNFSGFDRHRQRLHRQRHRGRHHRQPPPVDQLAEMLELTAPQEEEVHHPRLSKNIARREKNEDLCKSERQSRELNDDKFEYDPPFIVEVRCKNVYDYEMGTTTSLDEQSCVHDLLRCVQRYSEVQTVRRPVHSPQWHPYLLQNVPSGCDCMWPVDKYGHQEL